MSPDEIDALFQAAVAKHRAGDMAGALDGYRAVLAAAPSHGPSHQNLALVLRRLGRTQEALSSAEVAVRLLPDDAGAHTALGQALMVLRRADEALASYDRAAALTPHNAIIHQSRAKALQALDRHSDALEAVDQALACAPPSAGLHLQRGNLLYEGLRQPAEALASYDEALALDATLARAHHGRAAALAELGRPDDALAAGDAAVALDPRLAAAHRNRGIVLRKLGRTDEAIAAHDQAIALAPAHPDAYFYRGLAHLLQGRFDAGWRDYERRWEVEEFLRTARTHMTPALRARAAKDLTLARLRGEDVLLVGEQGVGDVIMFASLIPDLQAIAGRVALVCDPRLRRLFAASFPALELLDANAAAAQAADFAVITGIGSLGRLFRNASDDFPGCPYLRPHPDTVARWATRLPAPGGKLRIGLSWRGGLAQTGRTSRSIPLTDLRPILDLPGCDFFSLQYGDPSAEIAKANAALASPIRQFPAAEIDDFDDLAGLVANLDLVISVQTALVHLTGALGAPGLAMIPATPEWRYLERGETIPWYGSIRLLRQTPAGGWPEVLDRVADAVRARLGA